MRKLTDKERMALALDAAKYAFYDYIKPHKNYTPSTQMDKDVMAEGRKGAFEFLTQTNGRADFLHARGPGEPLRNSLRAMKDVKFWAKRRARNAMDRFLYLISKNTKDRPLAPYASGSGNAYKGGARDFDDVGTHEAKTKVRFREANQRRMVGITMSVGSYNMARSDPTGGGITYEMIEDLAHAYLKRAVSADDLKLWGKIMTGDSRGKVSRYTKGYATATAAEIGRRFDSVQTCYRWMMEDARRDLAAHERIQGTNAWDRWYTEACDGPTEDDDAE